MMKRKLLILFFFIVNISYAQVFNDSIMIFKNKSEIYFQDSMKLFFKNPKNDLGVEDFYRIGKIDKNYYGFIGEVKDFNSKGYIIMKSTMTNNLLEGSTEFYYDNGSIKEKGRYKEGKRSGVWVSYYPNKNLKMVKKYSNNNCLVVFHLNVFGDTLVKNGNGIFNDTILNINNSEYVAKGKLKNGRMDGKWEMFVDNNNIGNEVFNDGVFVKGFSMDEHYYDYPRIKVDSDITNEDVNISKDFLSSLFLMNYNLDGKLFVSEIDNVIRDEVEKNILSKKEVDNQWVICVLNYLDDFRNYDVKFVWSSVNDKEIEKDIESIFHSLRERITFEPQVRVNIKEVKNNEFKYYYLTFIVNEGKVYIPE